MKNFAITGVGGYVAPRHLKAIKDIDGDLIAALDKNDSVGILDKYFPESKFFNEYERFDRYLDKLRRKNSDREINFMCKTTYKELQTLTSLGDLLVINDTRPVHFASTNNIPFISFFVLKLEKHLVK